MDGLYKLVVIYALVICHGMQSMDSNGRMVRKINDEKTLLQVLQELQQEEGTPSTRWTTEQWEQIHEQRVRLQAMLEPYSSMEYMINTFFVTPLHTAAAAAAATADSDSDSSDSDDIE